MACRPFSQGELSPSAVSRSCAAPMPCELPSLENVSDCDSSVDCAVPTTHQRLITNSGIRLSEIIASLSVALDITQGNAQGHCMRTGLVGMRLAEQLRLPQGHRSGLFYALLLKDLGCSSNAAKITYLFGADDHLFKRNARLIDWTRPGA